MTVYSETFEFAPNKSIIEAPEHLLGVGRRRNKELLSGCLWMDRRGWLYKTVKTTGSDISL